ncbi:MAG: ankyrin repeat domain-containing protein [Nitrososphaerales archaeon]
MREFVTAGHGNLPRVKELLEQHPELLNVAYYWNETDSETAIQAAAQVGNRTVAEYLLSRGAPLAICTAAMLDKKEDVERILEQDPPSIDATGAHRIPLLTHAALSGNVELVQLLWRRGARQGASAALRNAVSRGHLEITRWLLENASPNLGEKNFQGKTALALAIQRNDVETARMLREHGAIE